MTSALLTKLRFAAEDVVVVLGEAVGFVADVLEEAKRKRVAREFDRVAFAGEKDFFFLLGKGEQGRGGDFLVAEGGEGGGELALAAVDEEDVGKDFIGVAELAVAPGDDFVNAAEVVDAGDAANLVAAIAGLKREAIEELDDAGDSFAAAEVGDIDAFDGARRFGKF